jgi:beta-glucosidase/6-phospho-beta-glucosidase/beta-galactosidase
VVMSFPTDFVWVAATSASQIEGAESEDGRGESISDRCSYATGAVDNGAAATVRIEIRVAAVARSAWSSIMRTRFRNWFPGG